MRSRRKETAMPKVSRESAAHVDDHGPIVEIHEDVDGTTIQFLTVRQDVDTRPLLKGLPDDRCPCEHWGYVFSGKLTFHFADHEETFEAGDAFSISGGHVPSSEPGTEYLQFSPADDLHKVSDTMMGNLRALQGV